MGTKWTNTIATGVMVGEELNVNFKYAVIFFEQLIIMNSSNKTDQNKKRKRKDPPSIKNKQGSV